MAAGSDKNRDARRVAFGRRVRAMREGAGLSQEELSERAGIHRTYLSGLERGLRNVGLDNILSIADGLGVEPADLFRDVL